MLKNYTSSVPVATTVSRIEQTLAKSHVTGIQKDYLNGRLTALCFRGTLPNGRSVNIRLPANTKAVYDVLLKKVKRPNKTTYPRVQEQAERTAWKLMQDWVEVQISLIEMQQADFVQVFLPYVWDGELTFYARLKEGEFKALPEVCP
jgi:hypothetical protein